MSKKRKASSLFTMDFGPDQPEIKSNDIQFSIAIEATTMAGYQAFGHLNGLGTGIGSNQRVGKTVNPIAMWVDLTLYKSDNTSGTIVHDPEANLYSLDLVWDRYPNAAPPPGAVQLAGNAWWYASARIFQNQSGVPSNVIAQPNVDLRDRYSVLWSTRFSNMSGQDEIHHDQVRVDLQGLRQVFNSGNTVSLTDIQEGACYLVVRALRYNGTVSSPKSDRLDIVARYFFTDN